jgi:cytoskeletal protein RodZ
MRNNDVRETHDPSPLRENPDETRKQEGRDYTGPSREFESPGKYLKATRESQKLSLKEVADATRIREPVLMALEEDRDLNLPILYRRSFLSAYAGCLGIDLDEVMTGDQRCEKKGAFSKEHIHLQSSIRRKKRVKVRRWVISISVVLFTALIAYAFFDLVSTSWQVQWLDLIRQKILDLVF